MIQKCKKILLVVFLLGLGIFSGRTLYRLQWKCLDIHYRHTSFYGMFGKELTRYMQKRGYLTTCPDILPKTIIYFYQTTDSGTQPKVSSYAHHTKIAFNGDCAKVTDIEYLRKFDILLNNDEYQNGFLSSFNFRTAFFPLEESYDTLCHSDFDNHQINMPEIAKRLDGLIQGVRHEKF